MATINFEGLDDLITLCEITFRQTKNIVGKSIYPGAAIMLQEAEQATANIITDSSHTKGMRKGPSEKQKQGLIESLGVAPIRKDDWGYNVKIGYDGYNGLPSKRSAKGQANILIARSVESGTSFMYPQHFMQRATERARQRVEEAIEKQFYEELEAIWEKLKTTPYSV